MKTSIFTMLILAFVSTSASSNPGKHNYEKLCLSCHLTSKTKDTKAIAPPIFAVKTHVKTAYPDREDFIQTIVDWVEDPDADASLMPGAIRKFGLMPKLPYAPSEVRKVAEFIYDTDFNSPNWYKKHYKAKHPTVQ